MRTTSYRNLDLVIFQASGVDPAQHVCEVEGAVGSALPDEYRNFLLACGPGPLCVIGPRSSFKISNGEEGRIEKFFGHDGECNDIVDSFYATRGRGNPNMLPIGRDSFDNLVCLGFRGKQQGKIYFWEKIGLPDENVEDDRSSTHLVAESFDEFIDSIQVADETW